MNNECLSELLTNNSFIEFLTYQVKGVLQYNFDCKHFFSNTFFIKGCRECTREFIIHSTFKNYFIKLYQWFKQIQTHQETKQSIDNPYYFFHPIDIINVTNTLRNSLKTDEIDYFNSSWLDGLYKVGDNFELLCVGGYLETLQWLYKCKEKNITLDTSQQQRILMQIHNKHPNVFQWLLSLEIFNKINIDIVFQDVCRIGSVEIVELLLKLDGGQRINSDIINGDALWWACDNGNTEVVRLLLSSNGNHKINNKTIINQSFLAACENGHLEIVKLLLELNGDQRVDVHSNNYLAFGMACFNEHLDIVKFLLELKGDRRIDIHYDNQTVFNMVCNLGSTATVKFLLELKGDRRIDVHLNDDWAFQMACVNGQHEVVKLLLNLEGDRKINDRTVINKAIKLVSSHEHERMVKLLNLYYYTL